MSDIREYCDRINDDKPDIFETCKDIGIIPKEIEKIEDLNEEMMKAYTREVKIYYDSYKLRWKDLIQKNLRFKNPNYFNAKYKAEVSNINFRLFVIPCFMGSGK